MAGVRPFLVERKMTGGPAHEQVMRPVAGLRGRGRGKLAGKL